jgi:hypothetical protein
MSQRVGDFGRYTPYEGYFGGYTPSELINRTGQDLIKPIQILKPVSQSELDRDEKKAKRLEQETALALEKLKQDEQAKVRKKYIMYGLIAVAGYFAYKKFK